MTLFLLGMLAGACAVILILGWILGDGRDPVDWPSLDAAGERGRR